MDELQLSDYFSMLKRRIRFFIITAIVVFLCSVVFAMRWNTYRSEATVEVAPADVSSSTTIPQGMSVQDYQQSLADLRISHLQQQVLSVSSLIEVITKFDLYHQARQFTPIADIAEGMEKNVKITLMSSALANASAASKATPGELSAIAFTISFDYSNPLTAQQVTNELVTRFLDEDLKERRNEAHKTSLFLDAQIKVMEASMDEQEKKIAEFRAANGNIQPESLAFNQQEAQSILMNIQNIDAQLTSNEGSQGNIRAQIAAVDPYSRVIADGQVLTTPTIQLKALKTQYATLSAQYGADHPDVIKLKHQIDALQKQVGGHTTADSAELEAKISDVRTNLAAAKKTYGPDYPDVLALQRQLDQLKKQLAEAQKHSGDAIRGDADNPAYLQLVDELKSSEEQQKSLMAEKDSLLEQEKKFQSALEKNPEAEQKLAALTRDYENSQLRYRELKEKKMAADMTETIEEDRSGQRLVILNPPELPLKTHPARILFVIGGFVLALLAGIVAVAGVQILSQSVIGPRHLESLIGTAPLVTIPHLAIRTEESELRRRRIRRVGLAVAAIAVIATVFSYTVMPLDVLWAMTAQRLGLY